MEESCQAYFNFKMPSVAPAIAKISKRSYVSKSGFYPDSNIVFEKVRIGVYRYYQAIQKAEVLPKKKSKMAEEIHFKRKHTSPFKVSTTAKPFSRSGRFDNRWIEDIFSHLLKKFDVTGPPVPEIFEKKRKRNISGSRVSCRTRQDK